MKRLACLRWMLLVAIAFASALPVVLATGVDKQHVSKKPYDYRLIVTINDQQVAGFDELAETVVGTRPSLNERAPELRAALEMAAVPVIRGQRLRFKVELETEPGLRKDITSEPSLFVDFAAEGGIQRAAPAELFVQEKPSARTDLTSGSIIPMVVFYQLQPSGKTAYNQVYFRLNGSPTSPAISSAERAVASQTRANEERERIKRSGQGPKPLSPDAFDYLSKLKGIKVNSQPSDLTQMVVFFDPNCPASRDLWRDLYGPGSRHREVASKWLPVSYMDKTSSQRIETLMRQRTSEALGQNFQNFDRKKRQGGAPASPVSPEVAEAIRNNEIAWKKLYPATPLIAFRTREGDFYQIGHIEGVVFDDLVESLAPSRLAPYEER